MGDLYSEVQCIMGNGHMGTVGANFVGLLLSGVSFSTPSSVTITSFAQILLSELSFQNG